ncbi:hypothetical protein DFH09DRAFT_1354649 [Mycena vulgaris]|nr:hypothetical protein DFH09DRAFT_1354649 [Mycena vulgaris]
MRGGSWGYLSPALYAGDDGGGRCPLRAGLVLRYCSVGAERGGLARSMHAKGYPCADVRNEVCPGPLPTALTNGMACGECGTSAGGLAATRRSHPPASRAGGAELLQRRGGLRAWSQDVCPPAIFHALTSGMAWASVGRAPGWETASASRPSTLRVLLLPPSLGAIPRARRFLVSPLRCPSLSLVTPPSNSALLHLDVLIPIYLVPTLYYAPVASAPCEPDTTPVSSLSAGPLRWRIRALELAIGGGGRRGVTAT